MMIGIPVRTTIVVSIVCVAMLAACGTKRPTAGKRGVKAGAVERAFNQAASKNGVPVRMMMAAAYLESRLVPDNASAYYRSLADTDGADPKGTVLTETAFGLTKSALGLDPALDTSSTLEAQIEAYGAFVGAQAEPLALPRSVRTSEDKYYWIQFLAQLHRFHVQGRTNTQVLFAKELIRVLNEGFIWQDPRDGVLLRLQPERPTLLQEDFTDDGQQWFDLTTWQSDIAFAEFLPLATVNDNQIENKPRRIEVIHCPLSLSSCLELQTRSQESEVRLEAHYIVPRDQVVTESVYQVARHHHAMIITDSRGEPVPVTDAIVVMLTGNSGRIVEGQRNPALPTWFTAQQLQRMALLVNEVCTLLSQQDGSIDRGACISRSGDYGVRFRNQGASEEHRWGDIADFDATIFGAYVDSPQGLRSEAAFEFSGGKKEFKGGNIPLTVQFNSQARSVEIERLARCTGGQVVWETVERVQVRGDRRYKTVEQVYDSGPNDNGQQFFRALVYGEAGELIGWSIDGVVLRDYEPGQTYASPRLCG